MSTRILYIEDEPALGRIVEDSLQMRGYRIDRYIDGRSAALALDNADQYDLAILDVMLPGEDGFTLGKRLREKFPDFPIIYLTARTQTNDVVEGFQSGGNDYLRKPFSLEELIVRIDNQMRLRGDAPITTSQTAPTAIFALGSLTFDYPRLRLESEDGEVLQRLSHREGELLKFMAERTETTIERQEILQTLWDDDSYFNSRTLDVYIRKLRQYLAREPRIQIITLRGVGYRFVIS